MYFLHARFEEEAAYDHDFVNKSAETSICITEMRLVHPVAP